MSKPDQQIVLDIGFFRIVGIALVTLTVTAGSIALSLTLKNDGSSVPSNMIANLVPAITAESQ